MKATADMNHPETTPQYLAACTSALLDALAEARALVMQGANGPPLREKLRFADDLMEIIEEAVNAAKYDRSASQAMTYLSGQVKSLNASIRPLALSM